MTVVTETWTRSGLRYEMKRPPVFREADHPRDRLGRFIETGATVRIWGGALATVLQNVGGGRIEIQTADGAKRVLHRNYLKVETRPDGSAPTSEPTEASAAPPVGVPSPDATPVEDPDSPVESTEAVEDAVATLVSAAFDLPGTDGDDIAQDTEEHLVAFTAALNDGTPDNEADERAALIDLMDTIEAEYPELAEETEAIRVAAAAEPDAANAPSPDATSKPFTYQTPTGSVDITVAVGDTIEYQDNGEPRSGEVIGFTANGGPLVRDQDGDEVPLLPDASEWEHRGRAGGATEPGPRVRVADSEPAAEADRPDPALNAIETPPERAEATERLRARAQGQRDDDVRTDLRVARSMLADAQRAGAGDQDAVAEFALRLTDADLAYSRDTPPEERQRSLGLLAATARDVADSVTEDTAFKRTMASLATEFEENAGSETVTRLAESRESGLRATGNPAEAYYQAALSAHARDTQGAMERFLDATSGGWISLLDGRRFLSDEARDDMADRVAAYAAGVRTGEATEREQVEVLGQITRAQAELDKRMGWPSRRAQRALDELRVAVTTPLPERPRSPGPGFDDSDTGVDGENPALLTVTGGADDLNVGTSTPGDGAPAEPTPGDGAVETPVVPTPAAGLGPNRLADLESVEAWWEQYGKPYRVEEDAGTYYQDVITSFDKVRRGDALTPDEAAAFDNALEASRMMALAAPAKSPDPGGDRPLTDEEYVAHAAFIEQRTGALIKSGQTTDKLFTIDPDNTVYSAPRKAQHEALIEAYWAEKAEHVANEGRAMISGGLGGAGKSTVIDQTQNQDDWLTLNPDVIKEWMAERGMLLQVDGFSPMETSTLSHEESSHITQRIAQRAYKERKNVIWDITMSSTESVGKRITAMEDAGYTEITGLFVDIDVETSVERALGRHKGGLNRYRQGVGLGGRYVPPFIIRENAVADASSANRKVFDALRHRFTKGEVWNTLVRPPQKVDEFENTPNPATAREVPSLRVRLNPTLAIRQADPQRVADERPDMLTRHALEWARSRGMSQARAREYASWYLSHYGEEDAPPAHWRVLTLWPGAGTHRNRDDMNHPAFGTLG